MRKLYLMNGLDYDEIKRTKPNADVYMMTQLLAGKSDKTRQMLEVDGLQKVTFDKDGNITYKPRLSKDGENMTIGWLLQPLADGENWSNASVKERMKIINDDKSLAQSVMTAQRTIDLAQRFERSDDITGLHFSKPDVIAAQEILDTFENNNTQATKDRVNEFASRYREMADATLEYARDKGLLSQETFDKIKDQNGDYVALNRIMMDEVTMADNPDGYMTGQNQTDAQGNPIKAIEGSLRDRGDAVENLIAAFYGTINKADKNHINNKFVDMLRGDGTGLNALPLAAFGEKIDSFDPDNPPRDVLVVFNNGVRENWKINDPHLANAIEATRGELLKSQRGVQIFDKLLWWSGIGAGVSVLQKSITKFPVFARVINPVRDWQQRNIYTRTGGTPFIEDAAKKAYDTNARKIASKLGISDKALRALGIKADQFTLSDKEALSMFNMYGGGQAGYDMYYKDESHYHNAMHNAMQTLTRSGKVTIPDVKTLMTDYNDMLSKGELSNRVKEFKSAYRHFRQQGLSEGAAASKAAFEARDLMDFAVKGEAMQFLRHLMPFLNANVQGTKRYIKFLGEMVSGDRKVEAMARFTIYSGLPSIMMAVAAAAGGYEEEYGELPDWRRDLFFNLKIPGWGWVAIPKPFEVGVLGSGIERFISRTVYGKKDAFDGYAGSAARNMTPINPFNPKETLLGLTGGWKPVIETITNWDNFRQSPVVSRWEENKNLKERESDAQKKQSGMAKSSKIARILSGATTKNPITDPRNIDHVIKGYFGYFGNHAIKLSNLLERETPARPSQKYAFMDSDFTTAEIMKELKMTRPLSASTSKSVQSVMEDASEYNRWQDDDIKVLLGKLKSFYTVEDKDEAMNDIIESAKIIKERYTESKKVFSDFLDGEDDRKYSYLFLKRKGKKGRKVYYKRKSSTGKTVRMSKNEAKKLIFSQEFSHAG